METAAELASRIEEQRQRRKRLTDRYNDAAYRELEAAKDRQALRRSLEEEQKEADFADALLQDRLELIQNYDADEVGETGRDASVYATAPPNRCLPKGMVKRCSTAYDKRVAKGEFVWEITGLSWLPQALEQECRECTESCEFPIDLSDRDSRYVLAFSPSATGLSDPARDTERFDPPDHARATLALIRYCTNFGTNLDVSFHVQNPETGDFVEWGQRTRAAWLGRPGGESRSIVVGPDLSTESKGVFGMSFKRLLRSGWVRDDKIVFKVCIQEIVMTQIYDTIRLGDHVADKEEAPSAIAVPPSTLSVDLVAMLTSGQHSDVTVEVAREGAEPVRLSAHANILSQRSDVFRAALSHVMQESETRTIRVNDLTPTSVRALLHFLYSDDFEQVETLLQHEADDDDSVHGQAQTALSAQTSTSGQSDAVSAADKRVWRLKAVLAAAHKYQVTRLLRWSEGQLCATLGLSSVCALLEMAHLYDATELARTCLKFMKAHQADIVVRDEFAALSKAALVKFHQYCAGIEPAEVGGVGRKRKRSSDS